MTTAPKRPHYADGEVFEMTLDFDAPENQPLAMVRRDGYYPKGWQHKGPTVKGVQTRKFKWVSVGYSPFQWILGDFHSDWRWDWRWLVEVVE